MYDLYRDKSVLVTGASSGLGRSIAIAFSNHCKQVILLGREEKKLDQTKQLCNNDCRIETYSIDLCDDNQIDKLFEAYGDQVDILINCAGIFPLKNIENTSLQEYDECMTINVRAPFMMCKEFSNTMNKKGWGRIVNVGSSSSYSGSGDTGLYCTSKHALLGLTRSLFLELRNTGVRVSFLSPGSIQTPMGETDKRQDFTTFIRPEEIADYLLHSLSYDAEMVSDEIRLNRAIIR